MKISNCYITFFENISYYDSPGTALWFPLKIFFGFGYVGDIYV
jgi:hypothetical protein